LATGKSSSQNNTQDVYLHTPQGQNKWVQQSVCVISTARGHRLAIVLRDITDRYFIQQALQETEEQFRAVVQTANDAIITMDALHNIVFWNAAAERIFGFLAAEMLGKPINEIVPAQYLSSNWHGVEGGFTDGSSQRPGQTIEVTGVNKRGEEVPLEMSFSGWKTLAGPFITAIIRDISERKRSEERNLQSEKKYRELFQVNKDGIAIFVISPDFKSRTFVELNEAAHEMLGYTKEEMYKLSPEMLEPEMTLAEFRYRQFELETKGVANFDAVLIHKDGHRVYTEFTAQVIQYVGQTAIMNIIRDVTDRKQRESELQAIAKLSEALRTAVTRADMLPVIVEQIVNLLHSDTATIEIIDPQSGDAVVEAACGAWSILVGTRQSSGTGINAIISRTLKPYHTHDLENDPNVTYHEWARENIRGSAGIPLIAQEKLIGFIWIGRKTDILDVEVRLLSAVADIAANAIHRTTSHEEALKATDDLIKAYDTTLEGWARALELRHQETEEHSQRVTEMTLQLARAFGLTEAEIIHIRRGAILHDIGKMGVPDEILLKEGPLREDEWEKMRKHPQTAYDLLSSIEHLRPALDIPYYHHEKWDGSGYPRGLAGENIPLAARIFAVVDVWDALRSDRVYRERWAEEKVRAYIREQAGTHFDPKIVELFLRVVDGKE
jgi:PAS domain S-box-containing protein/putative nucleotidyltransferase with HDIG domain